MSHFPPQTTTATSGVSQRATAVASAVPAELRSLSSRAHRPPLREWPASPRSLDQQSGVRAGQSQSVALCHGSRHSAGVSSGVRCLKRRVELHHSHAEHVQQQHSRTNWTQRWSGGLSIGPNRRLQPRRRAGFARRRAVHQQLHQHRFFQARANRHAVGSTHGHDGSISVGLDHRDRKRRHSPNWNRDALQRRICLGRYHTQYSRPRQQRRLHRDSQRRPCAWNRHAHGVLHIHILWITATQPDRRRSSSPRQNPCLRSRGPHPPPIVYGTALGATQLDATASVAGTFVYSPAAGTVLTAGQHTLTAVFTPTDTADYSSAVASVTLTVNRATPVVTWPTPATVPTGTVLGATQLNATANVPAHSPTAPPPELIFVVRKLRALCFVCSRRLH